MYNSYPVYENEESNKNDDLEFFFTTNFEITYILGFSNASYLFKTECLECSNIYSFRFYHIGKKGKRDPKINLTVIKTIQKFIVQHKCPIIYVCDTSTSEGLGRLLLFDRWSQAYSTDYFLTEQRIFETPDQKIPIGIIASSSDNNFYKYLDEIDTTWMG